MHKCPSSPPFFDMRQKIAIPLNSIDLVQARNCQVRLMHALENKATIVVKSPTMESKMLIFDTHPCILIEIPMYACRS